MKQRLLIGALLPNELGIGMKACILVKSEAGKHGAVCKEVAKLKGIKAAFSVVGRTDIVTSVDVVNLKELTQLAMKIGAISGVVATETLVAMEM